MRSEAESFSNTYEEDDLQLDLEVTSGGVMVVKKGSSALATVPAQVFKAALSKALNREVQNEELAELLKPYTGSLLIRADFSFSEGEEYDYGADADGNRGTKMRDLEDVEEDNLEINQAELRLIDENDEVLGGEDSFIDLADHLQKKNDPLVEYILNKINSDLGRYT